MATTVPTQSALTLGDYIAIGKRRFWLMVFVFVVVLAISVLVIRSLPPRYRSTAVVSVESQQIPEGLVQSTVRDYADQRIGFVNQRVMTTARLLEVIDKHRLYAEGNSDTPEALRVERLREHIILDTIRDPVVRKGRGSTVAFTLSFEHGDPEISAAVANDLVTMFLAENVRSRTAQATGTTQFLTQEAMRLGVLVSAMDARVAEFKQKHSQILPEHLDMRMGMLERSEAGLKALEREIASLREEMRFLKAQRASLGTILSAGTAEDLRVMSPAQRLASLKAELVDKSAVYGSAHPDLRSLRRRIALLEREAKSARGRQAGGASATVADPATMQIEAQIISADVRLASLREQKQELQEKIEGMQANIIETPLVEKELKDLTRDYENARTEYEEIKAKQQEAELAENLEEQEKAERFVLLESPMVPSVPVWPDKRKAYLSALFLAAGSSAGTAFLVELLDKTIRGPAMVTSILQRHPLAVIPFIESPRDRRRERVRRLGFLFALLIVLLGVLVIAHFYYQPISVLASSLFEAVLQ